MPSQTEAAHTGEFLMAPSDDMSTRSFDYITVDQNQALTPGLIIGEATVGALSAAGAALNTNAGNPTFGTITVAAGVPAGEYDLVCDDATHFHLLNPPLGGVGAGQEEGGHGVFGSAFSVGGIGFTLTAGGTPCVAGDSFKITVTAAAPSNNNTWGALNLSATDGTQNAGGLAYEAVTTGAGVTQQSVAVTREAEVNANLIGYPVGATDNQKAAINAQLAKKGIIVRT